MGCATSLVKYIVFIFNFLFLLAGIAFIAIGAVYLLGIKSFTATLDKTGIPFSLAPSLLIVFGVIVFVISFFGCCGAIKESSCLLITYGIILLVLFLLQVAIGVYAFIQFKDSNGVDKMKIEDELTKTLRSYNTNNQAKETFDSLQSQLECCGVKGPNDWLPGPTVPPSCCKRDAAVCYSSDAHREGCFEVLYKFLRKSITIIGIVIVSIGAIELLGAISALCLSCSL